MKKPTIFLSHSSSDKEYISKLNSIIKKRTANTVEVFQSSDGESIPFGNNWVHKIEENLNKTKIMFVFVSPKSAASSWIYFESGYAYSKGVKVIPIGIAGVDIGSIRPPLNLLQGFNINNEDGLGNLIAVINREFDTLFNDQFEKADYSVLSLFDAGAPQAKGINYVSKAVLHLHHAIGIDADKVSIRDGAPAEVVRILDESEIQYHKVDGDVFGPDTEISSHGLNIIFLGDKSLLITIALESIVLYESLINQVFGLYSEPTSWGWMELHPTPEFSLITDRITFSARMHKNGFNLAGIGAEFYEKNGFNVKLISAGRDKTKLLVNFAYGNFSSGRFYDLLGDLVDANIFQ